MIRRFDEQLVEVVSGEAKNVANIYCDSNDNKPTAGLVNGSRLTEVDTGKEYLFDESALSWTEVSSGGGGGNNNREEIIDGTLADIFGGTKTGTFATYFAEALLLGNASAKLQIDFSAIGISMELTTPLIAQLSGDAINVSAWYTQVDFTQNPISLVFALDIDFWKTTSIGGASTMYASKVGGYNNGSMMDLGAYKSYLTTRLYIYWHDMPTTPDEPIS